MKISLEAGQNKWYADLSQPIDISIPLRPGTSNPIAWYCGPVIIEPVVNEDFIGDVLKGGSVNFRDIRFNPHGHGTHTECVGHISREHYSINQCLTQFFFLCQVISVSPEMQPNDDVIIKLDQLKAEFMAASGVKAVAIRTLPNEKSKLTRNYSNTNPPYLDQDVAGFLADQEVDHLLVDLPSVDREKDQGVLASHHRFWNYPEDVRLQATITEFIYIPDEVPDGLYLLNIQIASFENDASPSKPVLYRIEKV